MDKHNKNNILQRALLSLGCTAFGVLLIADDVQARIKFGLWEITVQVQMDGAPVDTPQETFKKCITRRDLTPGDNKDKVGCEKDKVSRKGDKVSWTVSCAKDKHTMTGNGMVVYSGNTMTGYAQFQAGGKGLATMNMKLQYKGKRLGKCK